MALSSTSKCVVLAVLLVSGFARGGQDMHNADDKKNPFAGQKAAIAAGEERFKSGCAACHGSEAQGGRGPALAGNRDLQGMTDQQLFNTIRQGIPGTSMPPSQMPDEQTWQVATFVRNLSSPASLAILPGDRTAGREIFFGKGGCSQCHAVRGVGGLLGPDLSNAGADLTVRELRESILKPSAAITPGFESSVVYLKDGTKIAGVTKDNTNYSIGIMDMDGHLHLLSKADVSRIDFNAESLMPGDFSRRLTPDQLDDVVNWLASQTVRQASDVPQQHRQRGIH